MMIYKAIRVLCCLAILPNAVMAKFETRQNNNLASEGSTLFHCVDLSPNTYAAPPALAPDPATVEAETFPALCPDGQVPQPQDWFGPKGRLIPSSGESPDMHQTTQLPGGLYYLYKILLANWGQDGGEPARVALSRSFFGFVTQFQAGKALVGGCSWLIGWWFTTLLLPVRSRCAAAAGGIRPSIALPGEC